MFGSKMRVYVFIRADEMLTKIITMTLCEKAIVNLVDHLNPYAIIYAILIPNCILVIRRSETD